MRRIFLCTLCLLSLSLMVPAAEQIKGQFDLYLNGVNKGYEKFKVVRDKKDKLLSVSAEVRFQLPFPKAKRNYVDLYLYPSLDLDLETGTFEGYSYRLTFNDFSDKEMVEAENSATEIIDQDFRNYDIFNRGSQLAEDEQKNRIDLGVNSGKCYPVGATLHFQQTRFSDSRVKDEPLPPDLVVLDAYSFCLYIPMAEKAKAMKGDSMTFPLALPQTMKLKTATMNYMGTEKTPYRGKVYILKHYDIFIGEEAYSSFWVDQDEKVVQVVIPAEGLVASLKGYEPKTFNKEEPRTVKQQAVQATSAFTETTARIPSGSIQLGATLTLPKGQGPFVTILMVQDLMPADRDGNDPQNPYSRAGTWKQLAYTAAEMGFATLRWDSRGVGESGGDLEKVSLADRAQDLQALGAWLKAQPTTRDKNVYLLSMGLSGWVAADAAAKGGFAGLIAIAYPAKGLMRLWKEQVGSMNDPEARQGAYRDLDAMSSKIAEGSTEEWVDFKGQKIYLPFVKELAKVDPLALASSVKVPCLFAYPSKDMTVMAFHKEVLSSSLHAGQEAVVIDGLGHRLTSVAEESGPSGLVEGKRLTPIADWLAKQGGGGTKP